MQIANILIDLIFAKVVSAKLVNNSVHWLEFIAEFLPCYCVITR